jgi:hypothetical protein
MDRAARISIDNELDDRGVEVRVPVGSRIFFPPRRSDRPGSRVYPTYYLMETEGSFPGGKAAGA